MTNNRIELWLDCVDPNIITFANEMGLVQGVTTNPSILSKNNLLPESAVKLLLPLFDGPMALQVTEEKSEKMVEQAKYFRSLSDRIIVKVPCVQEGYKAMVTLKDDNIPVLATTIYTFRQLVIATMLGAKYAAPYYSRIIAELTKECGHGHHSNPEETANHLIRKMQSFAHERGCTIMVAAISSSESFDTLLSLGTHCATLPAKVFENWAADFPKAKKDLDVFQEDWSTLTNTQTNQLPQREVDKAF